MNNKANPIITSPQDLFLFRFENINGNPTPISGNAKALIFTLKPINDMIHAVTVVPILAPIITPIDSTRDNNPALTKLTTITVVAEEDWITAVTKTPVNTPNTLFDVIAERIFLRLLPATFCSASLINFIPKRKRTSAPTNSRKSKIPYSILKSICHKFKSFRPNILIFNVKEL